MRESKIRAVQFAMALTVIAMVTVVTLGFQPYSAFATTATPVVFQKLADPVEGKLDEAAIKAIDLKALPILPDFDKHADYLRAIYQEGVDHYINNRVFAKVGDCMTANDHYLVPFAKSGYTLDKYASLQAIIDHFGTVPVRSPDSGLNSFSNPSLAAASGFNAANVLEAIWADTKFCGAEEAPLACELRLNKAAIALIMFGTNDLKSLSTEQFNFYLRKVVVDTINAGVIPVMSTFPNQPGLVDKSIFYNQIIVQIAQDYNVPLINLWRAFEPLPHQGIDPKAPTHMTMPASGNAGSFAEADLQGGYNVFNLLTLQALEGVLKIIGVL